MPRNATNGIWSCGQTREVVCKVPDGGNMLPSMNNTTMWICTHERSTVCQCLEHRICVTRVVVIAESTALRLHTPKHNTIHMCETPCNGHWFRATQRNTSINWYTYVLYKKEFAWYETHVLPDAVTLNHSPGVARATHPLLVCREIRTDTQHALNNIHSNIQTQKISHGADLASVVFDGTRGIDADTEPLSRTLNSGW